MTGAPIPFGGATWIVSFRKDEVELFNACVNALLECEHGHNFMVAKDGQDHDLYCSQMAVDCFNHLVDGHWNLG